MAVSDSKWPPDIHPVFPWAKEAEHVQEALVKETGWNDGVAGIEQRGVLSVGRDVCYTTDFRTQPYRMRSRHSLPENGHTVKRTISTRNLRCVPERALSLSDPFLAI